MGFVWFWTFWHWSRESFRCGSLLRSPLHGIGGHWDEWYRHEASAGDRQTIEDAGRTEAAQRQFIAWLYRHWAREAGFGNNRLIPRFVLGQLSHLPPFDEWRALARHRDGYGGGGVPAIVLAEDSPGEADDVRVVEALMLPADAAGQAVAAEGFQADAPELDTPYRAAMSMLGGRGLFVFLALWTAGGHRPYPAWARVALGLGWAGVGGLIAYLLAGPDPGDTLVPLSGVLLALWAALVATAATVAAVQGVRAWRQGRQWLGRLGQSQVRLRMGGGLTLRGGSAGAPFVLNTLLALYHADPPAARRSWIWHRFFRHLRAAAPSWAATGTVTADARLRPVVLEPKLRACARRAGITHILTPRQPEARPRAIDALINPPEPASSPAPARRGRAPEAPPLAPLLPVMGARLGFAAEPRRLISHRGRHLAQSMMAVGDLTSRWQAAFNAVAAALSVAMIVALPDLRGILVPPAPAAAVAPASPSAYHLWVSLDTRHPRYFWVTLESAFWSNRRAAVMRQRGATPSARAEIRLHPLARPTTRDEDDGTVWVERRRRFLTREFAPGERVGRFTLSYLTSLGQG